MEIKLAQILFQIINFGVVFGALTVLLYKPILKMLDARAEKISKAAQAADETLRERDEVEQIKKKSKLQSDKDAAKLLEKAREQAQELKKDLVKQAKEELKLEREKTMESWKQEKQTLAREMEKQFASAVYAVSEKLLGSAIDKKSHAKLIDAGIKDIVKIM